MYLPYTDSPAKTQAFVWQTPVAIELTDNELEGLLAIGAAGATEEGDACCALLDVFLEARLAATEAGDSCEAFAEVEAIEQRPRSLGAAAVDEPSPGYRTRSERSPKEPRKPNGASERQDQPREPRNYGSQKPPKFQLVAWIDITFDPEDEWRVEGVFPKIGIACLYGGPGAVETFIWLDLFVRIARGGFWGGREVKQGPVIYIAAEGAGGIGKRIEALKKIAASKGLPADVPFYLITVAPNLGAGIADRDELIRCIKAIGVQPAAIAIDTAAQSIGGADENGAGMAQLVANGTAIANYFACLVGLIHHNPLGDEDRLRGWTGLLGGLNVSILSRRAKGSLTATLDVKKMKDEDDTLSFTVTLARVVLGQTKSGRDISTLVVETVEPGATEIPRKGRRGNEVEDLAEEFLRTYDRLAAPIRAKRGEDGDPVKVSVDAIRDELKRNGFLETDEDKRVIATARSRFRRAKDLLKKPDTLVERDDQIWRP
jgi:hypothetical protein